MQNLEPAHDCFWNVIFWKIGCMSKRCGSIFAKMVLLIKINRNTMLIICEIK